MSNLFNGFSASTVFPDHDKCFGDSSNGSSICQIPSDIMIRFLNISSPAAYLSVYCDNPPADSCSFGYCPNPDVASPAVRYSSAYRFHRENRLIIFYLRSLLHVARFCHPCTLLARGCHLVVLCAAPERILPYRRCNDLHRRPQSHKTTQRDRANACCIAAKFIPHPVRIPEPPRAADASPSRVRAWDAPQSRAGPHHAPVMGERAHLHRASYVDMAVPAGRL